MIHPAHALAIATWIESVLVELDGDYAGRVIMAPANGPTPARPWASVRILSDVAAFSTVSQTTDEPGDVNPDRVKHHRDSFRRGICAVSLYGASASDHVEQLEMARADLEAQIAFDTAEVWLTSSRQGPVFELESHATAVEQLAIVEFEYQRIARRTTEIDWIETVNVTSDEGDLDGFDETYGVTP